MPGTANRAKGSEQPLVLQRAVCPSTSRLEALPTELLVKVIRASVPQEHVFADPYGAAHHGGPIMEQQSRPTAIDLAHVSSHIRAVVLDTPSLFDHITIQVSIPCYAHKPTTIDLLSFFLQHASPHPLHITIDIIDDNPYSLPLPKRRSTPCPCLDMLMAQSWRSLILQSSDIDTVTDFLVRKLTRAIFRQETLQSCAIMVHQRTMASKAFRLLDALATRHCHGHLTLSLSPWVPSTSSLQPSLGLITTATISTSGIGYLYILQCLPNLQSICLNVCYDEPDARWQARYRWANGVIQLRQLRSLRLSITARLDTFVIQTLREIDTPELTTLDLDWKLYNPPMLPDLIQSLECLISRSLVPLQRLRIRAQTNPPALSDCKSAMQRLLHNLGIQDPELLDFNQEPGDTDDNNDKLDSTLRQGIS